VKVVSTGAVDSAQLFPVKVSEGFRFASWRTTLNDSEVLGFKVHVCVKREKSHVFKLAHISNARFFFEWFVLLVHPRFLLQD
jgi:hypothetical protein